MTRWAERSRSTICRAPTRGSTRWRTVPAPSGKWGRCSPSLFRPSKYWISPPPGPCATGPRCRSHRLRATEHDRRMTGRLHLRTFPSVVPLTLQRGSVVTRPHRRRVPRPHQGRRTQWNPRLPNPGHHPRQEPTHPRRVRPPGRQAVARIRAGPSPERRLPGDPRPVPPARKAHRHSRLAAPGHTRPGTVALPDRLLPDRRGPGAHRPRSHPRETAGPRLHHVCPHRTNRAHRPAPPRPGPHRRDEPATTTEPGDPPPAHRNRAQRTHRPGGRHRDLSRTPP